MSSSATGLTEEQRRRKEENRQKALEKLAASKAKAAAAAAGQAQTQTPRQPIIPSASSNTFSSSISSAPFNRQSTFTSNTNSTSSYSSKIQSNGTGSGLNTFKSNPPVNQYPYHNQNNTSSFSNSNSNNFKSGYRPPYAANGNGRDNAYTSVAPSSNSQPKFGGQGGPGFSGRVVTGVCLMISRDRFLVDMGFHAQTVALFKTIDGAGYDPMRKKWTFPLSQHSKVIAVIESLKPDVTVCPLPSFVLRIFRKAETTSRIPDQDLSPIDPVCLQALLPFQREGVCFGVSRGGRVLIADDMGLGKTIQALAIAHYYHSDWPLLIATPSSMRYSWRESIWNWLPSVPAGGVVVVETKQDSISDAKVLIMSYDLLHKRAEEPPMKNCKVVIIDESHYIKNTKTARAKAAIPILQNAKRAILLSGTPALSRPIELYSQLIAISPMSRNVFPHVNDFGVRYCAGKKTAWGWDHLGSCNMEELQLVLEETVMIRRLKSDVLKQLPPKRRQVIMLDPKLVRKGKNEMLKLKAAAFMNEKQKSAQHGKLLEYFSETGKTKLEAIKNYVIELVESGRKFLCFAHHRAVLDGICEALEEANCGFVKICGGTASEERKILVDKFQFSDSCLVAVLSITAANAGITLTAASLVVFAELFWNPGILTQAEDRAHRIGQEDCVMVQYLIAKGTADDELWAMVADKLDVLNKAGLSKDNFREAKANAEAQVHHSSNEENSASQNQNEPSSSQIPRQTGIQEFFKPSSQIHTSSESELSPLIVNKHNQNDTPEVSDLDNVDDNFFDDADNDDFLSVTLPAPDPVDEIPESAFESEFDDSQSKSDNQDEDEKDLFGDENDEAMEMEGDDSLFALTESNAEFLDQLEAKEQQAGRSKTGQQQIPGPGGFFLNDSDFDTSFNTTMTDNAVTSMTNNAQYIPHNNNNSANSRVRLNESQLERPQPHGPPEIASKKPKF